MPTRRSVSRQIERLGDLRSLMSHLVEEERRLVTQVRAAGGGSSSSYVAYLIKRPACDMHIRAHVQLRVRRRDG